MKQDIGHFYKDQFKNYEVAPSGDAFKLIREKWEQQHKRRIYKKRILVSAGCVAFVAALFLVFHWLSGSAKKSLPQKNPSEAISVQAFQDTVVIAKQEMLKSIQSELADIKINTVSTEKTSVLQFNLLSDSLEYQDTIVKTRAKGGHSFPNHNLNIDQTNQRIELSIKQTEQAHIANIELEPSVSIVYPQITCTSDTIICQHKPLLLYVNHVSEVSWSFGSSETAVEVYPDEDVVYEAYIKTLSGKDSVIRIEVQVVDCDIFIPNAFTPNGDGLNDVFKIETDMEFKLFELSIYTKTGKLMFTTHSPNAYWDGTNQGQPLIQDMYIYMILYTDKLGKKHQLKGHFMLLR